MNICPKCLEIAEDWDDYLTDHRDTACPFLPCDDPNYRALKSPKTLEHWRESAGHWRFHRYLSGCSHGR